MHKVNTRFFIIIIAIWVADFFTKMWAVKSLEISGNVIRVMGNFFRFRFAENTGGVFGIFQGNPMFFQVLTGLAIIFLFIYYLRTVEDSKIFNIAISFILGGAISNFTDRFFRQGVVDFIDIGLGDSRWPTFNIADIFITLGAVLLAIAFYQFEKAAKLRAANEPQDTGK